MYAEAVRETASNKSYQIISPEWFRGYDQIWRERFKLKTILKLRA
jgi:hypothetical protein